VTEAERAKLAQVAAEIEQRLAYRIRRYYPADGPLSRSHYPKHLAFFAAGNTHRERLFLAANRVGKSDAGAYEITCHLTGVYPEWWEGRRFACPTRCWAAGDTGKTVRDIVQVALLGPPGAQGTGMIPAHTIVNTTAKSGVADAIETVTVKHATGGTSTLALKSYDQRREAFQGTSQHAIWLDEEPGDDIYTECLLRTMNTPDLPGGGIVMVTFTPLLGMTPLVLTFLPDGHEASDSLTKAVVTATWDDCPHLDAQAKADLWASIPPFQRDARSKGVPQLGSGAIYQVPESDITVAPFEIPAHWPRCFGLDTGWDATAAAWLAHDRDTQTVYVYADYRRGQAEAPIHAEAIKAKGLWIPGSGDAAAINNQDGQQFLAIYRRLGLDLELANKGVEAGIQRVWDLLSAGKLKVFASCRTLLEEYRLYRRDEKGRVVKINDHVMDALRYAVVSGLERAKVQPVKREKAHASVESSSRGQGWLGA
jgi:phage terminase large subunit-like protein